MQISQDCKDAITTMIVKIIAALFIAFLAICVYSSGVSDGRDKKLDEIIAEISEEVYNQALDKHELEYRIEKEEWGISCFYNGYEEGYSSGYHDGYRREEYDPEY